MSLLTDRIEKEILIKAPPSRVWQALSNAEEFGEWFGVALNGKTFTVGQHVQGQITFLGYEHLAFDVLVVQMEAEHLFSWRWHPYAIDPKVDYSQEPTTLVEFRLKAVEDGTLLSVAESGFDNIPPKRRLEAFRMNSGGWDQQVANIKKHLSRRS